MFLMLAPFISMSIIFWTELTSEEPEPMLVHAPVNRSDGLKSLTGQCVAFAMRRGQGKGHLTGGVGHGWTNWFGVPYHMATHIKIIKVHPRGDFVSNKTGEIAKPWSGVQGHGPPMVHKNDQYLGRPWRYHSCLENIPQKHTQNRHWWHKMKYKSINMRITNDTMGLSLVGFKKWPHCHNPCECVWNFGMPPTDAVFRPRINSFSDIRV